MSSEATQVRTKLSLEPQGLRYGPLSIQAGGAEAIGYTTNADLNTGGHSSVSINTEGHLSAVAELGQKDQAHAEINVSDTRYPSRTVQNRTTWTATVGGTRHLGHDELGIEFTHLSLVQMPTDSGAIVARGPIPYTVEDGRVSYLVQSHGRLGLRPEIIVQRYGFGMPDFYVPGTKFLDQSYRDRVIVTEGLTAQYDALSNSHWLIVAQGTQIRYTTKQDFAVRDSNGFAVLGGYSYDEPGMYKFRVVGGYQVRDYAAQIYNRITSPIVDATFQWEPTRLTTVALSLTRGIEDSAFENIVGFVNTAAKLDVTHELMRNVTLMAHATVTSATYAGTPSALDGTPLAQQAHDQNMYGFGIGAQVFLNRHLSLNLSYDYSSESLYSGPMFPVHVVQLSLHFAL